MIQRNGHRWKPDWSWVYCWSYQGSLLHHFLYPCKCLKFSIIKFFSLYCLLESLISLSFLEFQLLWSLVKFLLSSSLHHICLWWWVIFFQLFSQLKTINFVKIFYFFILIGIHLMFSQTRATESILTVFSTDIYCLPFLLKSKGELSGHEMGSDRLLLTLLLWSILLPTTNPQIGDQSVLFETWGTAYLCLPSLLFLESQQY